jgi:hypothetical protein
MVMDDQPQTLFPLGMLSAVLAQRVEIDRDGNLFQADFIQGEPRPDRAHGGVVVARIGIAISDFSDVVTSFGTIWDQYIEQSLPWDERTNGREQ